MVQQLLEAVLSGHCYQPVLGTLALRLGMFWFLTPEPRAQRYPVFGLYDWERNKLKLPIPS